MSYQKEEGSSGDGDLKVELEVSHTQDRKTRNGTSRGRDEVYSRRVPAGKRTYFFDVKSTRSGDDFFVTITESKRVDEGRYEKHKIFLYKEDFGKFVSAMHEVIQHIKDDRLPDYDFRGLPELDGESNEQETLSVDGFASDGFSASQKDGI